MINKKKKAATAVATFGAALSSAFLAPELQADIVDITWNGGNASASIPFSSGTFNVLPFNVDQAGTGSQDFRQYNDQFGGDGVGRSMFGGGSEFQALLRASSGQVIDPATFTGGSAFLGTGSNTTFVGSGSEFVGFRDVFGNVGWFKVDFTAMGPMIFTVGQYGSMGEAVTVGDGGGTGCTNPLGDVNLDGIVSLADVSPFVALLTGGGFQCEADVNEDGVVSLADVNPFVQILTGG